MNIYKDFVEHIETQRFVIPEKTFFWYRSKVKFNIYGNEILKKVDIDQIWVPKRFQGKGYGIKFLNMITNEADHFGIRLDLEAFPFEANKDTFDEDQARLVNLYERFGFIRTYEDASKHLGMKRLPKS